MIKAFAENTNGTSRRTPVTVQAMMLRNQGLSERQVVNRISRNTGRSTADIRQTLNRATFTR